MTGAAIARYKTIDPRNTYLARQRLQYWEPGMPPAGAWLPWTGRDDITVRFSDEPTGFTDEGYASTIAGLGPFDCAEATGDPGVYYYGVPVTALQEPLLARIGQVIYAIFEGGAEASGTYLLNEVVPLMVVEPRYAT